MNTIKDGIDARFSVRGFVLRPDQIGHSAARVAEWLAGLVDLLMVVNVVDPEPPAEPAKLFMTNTEWRRFVFPLIAEASAILLILPPDTQALTGGIKDELIALEKLGRNADTIAEIAKGPQLLIDLLQEKIKEHQTKP
jgi:hypothetical protein